MSDGVPPAAGVSAEPVSVIRVSPEQFKIEVVLHQESFLELSLHNTSSSLATFKVKTTARDRYLLRPTQDYIPPHGTRVCKIVMSALSQYPDLTNPKNLKDKFLVQATTIEREVSDLTKMWKDLETQHNPKAGVYMYAETKIKCKLSVPAKYRAADATKRGLEEEAAAAAATAAAAAAAAEKGAAQSGFQAAAQNVTPARAVEAAGIVVDADGARRKLSSEQADFAAMALLTPPGRHVDAAVPAPSITSSAAAASSVTRPPASASLPASAAAHAAFDVSGSLSHDPTVLSRELKASQTRYAELMEFVVKTTQQLESERAEKETLESRAQAQSQSVEKLQARLDSVEAKLAQAREEIKRQAVKTGGSDDTEDSELRRRKERDSVTTKIAAATAAATAASAVSPPIRPLAANTNTALADSKQAQGLSLQLWQVALLALVCFVLGRIFA